MAVSIVAVVFGGILLFGLCSLIFWIWMLVDCAQNCPDKDNLKLIWLLVIFFAGFIGALIYCFAQRPNNFLPEDMQ